MGRLFGNSQSAMLESIIDLRNEQYQLSMQKNSQLQSRRITCHCQCPVAFLPDIQCFLQPHRNPPVIATPSVIPNLMADTLNGAIGYQDAHNAMCWGRSADLLIE